MSVQVLGSVNVYIMNGGKLLLSRRTNTGWMDGHLCAPGGHVEPGESPTDAALRELKEELGLNLKKSNLEFLCVAARNTKPNQYVAYEFLVNGKGLKIVNKEPNKCSELVWVDPKNLPADVIPHFRSIIEQSLVSNKKYLELDFN